MIRLFSESNPISILLLFLLGALIRIPYFVNPDMPEFNADAGYLYSLFHAQLMRVDSSLRWIAPVIAYVCLFIQGLSLNGFVNSQKLFGATHSLFVFVYILFTALIPLWNELTPFLLVNMLMILIIPKLAGLFNQRNVQNEIFTLTVLISLCSLIYKPALLYLLLVYIALLTLRPFRLSEWIIVVIGFFLPYYLMLVYSYVWDVWDKAALLIPSVQWRPLFLDRDPADLISLLFVLIPLVGGAIYARKYIVRALALQRKIWAIAFYYLLITLVTILFAENQRYDNFLLLLIPASFYITAFFYFSPVRFFPNVLTWLMLAFLAVRHFL